VPPPTASHHIKAPIQAENGAVVPIAVSTQPAGRESIAIFVQGQRTPAHRQRRLSGAEATSARA